MLSFLNVFILEEIKLLQQLIILFLKFTVLFIDEVNFPFKIIPLFCEGFDLLIKLLLLFQNDWPKSGLIRLLNLSLKWVPYLIHRNIHFLNQIRNLLCLFSLSFRKISIDELHAGSKFFYFSLYSIRNQISYWILKLNKHWIQQYKKFSHLIFNILLKINFIITISLNFCYSLFYHFFLIKFH